MLFKRSNLSDCTTVLASVFNCSGKSEFHILFWHMFGIDKFWTKEKHHFLQWSHSPASLSLMLAKRVSANSAERKENLNASSVLMRPPRSLHPLLLHSPSPCVTPKKLQRVIVGLHHWAYTQFPSAFEPKVKSQLPPPASPQQVEGGGLCYLWRRHCSFPQSKSLSDNWRAVVNLSKLGTGSLKEALTHSSLLNCQGGWIGLEVFSHRSVCLWTVI